MKTKKLLLGLGVVSLPILPLLVMTSCSSEPTHKCELTPVSFDIFDSIEKANVISTSLNHNIWENMMEKKSKLTVDELQKDFDSVITPLYLINQNKIKTPVKIIQDVKHPLSWRRDRWAFSNAFCFVYWRWINRNKK